MNAQIIEMDGLPAFVVVPMAKWTALLERLEDLQDIADAKAAREEETLSMEFDKRRLMGEAPLKLWREHRGLTLQALAERAGCTRQMLSMIEHGKAAPSNALLARLATGLGVDMDDLHAAGSRGKVSPVASSTAA